MSDLLRASCAPAKWPAQEVCDEAFGSYRGPAPRAAEAPRTPKAPEAPATPPPHALPDECAGGA